MASRRKVPASPRLQDIAALAGVSINTVSRALNDRPDVSPATRARVRAIAERLGYSPNMLARSLVSGLTHSIGLVVTDCTDPYYATLIRAAEDTLSREGFGLLLATSNEEVEKERRGLDLLAARRVDGLLLTAVDVEAPHIARLLQERLPVVLLSRRPQGHEGGFVGVDNHEGAAMAIRHLVGYGHRRIAVVGRAGPASSGRERLAGCRAELRAQGLEAPPVLLALPTVEAGREAAAWLLALAPRPSAVVTYNDSQAVGLIKGLQSAGVAVPRQVSVVGFDDIALATLVEPPLTTIAQPISAIGREGALMLLRRLQGPAAPLAPLVLPCHLVVRGSTAPPAARAHRIRSSGSQRVKPGM